MRLLVFICFLSALLGVDFLPNYTPKDYLVCVDPSEFEKLFARPLPEWMHKQIHKDLEFFLEKGVTQEALGETFEHAVKHVLAPWGHEGYLKIHRFRCIDGKVYLYNHSKCGNDQIEYFLVTLAKLGRLPNVDFLVCDTDGVPEEYLPKDFWITRDAALQAPLLARAKMCWAPYVVLIPDGQSMVDWLGLSKWILERAPHHRWKKKINQVAWRGTSSDLWVNNMNECPPEEIDRIYRTRPRRILSQLSVDFPDYVNAGFNYVLLNEGLSRATQGLVKEAMTWDQQMDYKYLPVLDGWCCTYPGYLWRLLSGSLTMKQQLDSRQWFYDALIPYVHYLPIQGHMEDLIEKIKWARKNDAQCRKMAENARNFVLENLMPNHIYFYFSKVLEHYSSLQRFAFDDLEREMVWDSNWCRLY